jgi:Tfp pilus assembly protein PilF
MALGYVGAGTTSLARLNLGEIFYRSGKLAAAERELQAVVDAQPGNVPALLWLAKTVRDQGRTRAALELYGRALDQKGDNGDALIEAVSLAVQMDQPDTARRLVARASAHTSAAATHVARAIAAGREDAAERELRQALRAEPTFLPALTRLLDLLVAAGRPADARPVLDEAADAAPDSPAHLALAGEAALAAGDAAAAERRLQQALRLAPDADAVKLDLARARLALGRADLAIATLDGVAPSSERSLLLGAAHSQRREWDAATREYRRALAERGASPDLLNGLAWAELQRGERSAATDLLERSLSLKPDQPEMVRLLAEIRSGRSR